MESILIRTSMQRLPVSFPKQITEDFKIRTQAVNFIFRGFLVAPSSDMNGLRLSYTANKHHTVSLYFNSGIIIDTENCQQKLFISTGGTIILRHFDPNNELLPYTEPWQGTIQVGNKTMGFLEFPFDKTQVDIFTEVTCPKQYLENVATAAIVQPPRLSHLPITTAAPPPYDGPSCSSMAGKSGIL